MLRALAVLGMVAALAGCGVSVPLVTAVAGFGAAALHLDDDLFEAWAARRGVTVQPASCPLPAQGVVTR